MVGRPVRTGRGGPQDPDKGPTPARGYSWQPFTEGNVASVRHGANSPRVLAEAAARIVEQVYASAPWTRADAFAWKVARFARAEAAARARWAWLSERGFVDDEGSEVPGWVRWVREEASAAAAEEALGLSPQSMAKLLGSLTAVATATGDDDALESLRSEGRRILAARALALAAEDDDDDPEAA